MIGTWSFTILSSLLLYAFDFLWMGAGKYKSIAPFPIPFVSSYYSFKSQLHSYTVRVAAMDICHSLLASVEARYFCFQDFFEPEKRHHFAKQKYVSQISNWKNQDSCRFKSMIHPIFSDYISCLFNLVRGESESESRSAMSDSSWPHGLYRPYRPKYWGG